MDHVQLAMPEGGEDVARRFYGELLGLPETPKPAVLAVRGGCWFEDGDVRIHLGVEADFRPARKAHPAFVVDGLAALVSHLEQHNVEVMSAEPLDGIERVHISDPFGNRIELMEPNAEHPGAG
jgi:catechol 2,3-dioxygenase-like lactoylglutathione lyase family enzyme